MISAVVVVAAFVDPPLVFDSIVLPNDVVVPIFLVPYRSRMTWWSVLQRVYSIASFGSSRLYIYIWIYTDEACFSEREKRFMLLKNDYYPSIYIY